MTNEATQMNTNDNFQVWEAELPDGTCHTKRFRKTPPVAVVAVQENDEWGIYRWTSDMKRALSQEKRAAKEIENLEGRFLQGTVIVDGDRLRFVGEEETKIRKPRSKKTSTKPSSRYQEGMDLVPEETEEMDLGFEDGLVTGETLQEVMEEVVEEAQEEEVFLTKKEAKASARERGYKVKAVFKTEDGWIVDARPENLKM
jgi:hypothetical protein